MNVLVLCGRNKRRSPTAERILRRWPGVRARAAGFSPRSPRTLRDADLQWADVDSVALLDDLTRPDRAPPLMLICCFRSVGGEAPSFLTTLRHRPGDDNTIDLPVGPLTEVEAGHLVRLRIHSGEVTRKGSAVLPMDTTAASWGSRCSTPRREHTAETP